MRRETPFTLEEAKVYITKSVEEWGVSSQTEKIISLASYAYNRNNKASNESLTSKLKKVQTIINGIDVTIIRMMKLDMDADFETLVAKKEEYEKQAADLVKQLEKNPPVRRNVTTGRITTKKDK